MGIEKNLGYDKNNKIESVAAVWCVYQNVTQRH
jgi:hypothetical protein